MYSVTDTSTLSGSMLELERQTVHYFQTELFFLSLRFSFTIQLAWQNKIHHDDLDSKQVPTAFQLRVPSTAKSWPATIANIFYGYTMSCECWLGRDVLCSHIYFSVTLEIKNVNLSNYFIFPQCFISPEEDLIRLKRWEPNLHW